MDLKGKWRITKEDTLLLVIDCQDRLIQAINQKENFLFDIGKLVDGLTVLGLGIIYSEQNPSKLGKTVNRVMKGNPKDVYSKMEFSSFQNEAIKNRISSMSEVRNIIVCGLETHVCVQQTCFDLIHSGYGVYVPTDATSSRSELDKEVAISRLESLGVSVTTTEALLFEICRTAENRAFKDISAIVKRSLDEQS